MRRTLSSSNPLAFKLCPSLSTATHFGLRLQSSLTSETPGLSIKPSTPPSKSLDALACAKTRAAYSSSSSEPCALRACWASRSFSFSSRACLAKLFHDSISMITACAAFLACCFLGASQDVFSGSPEGRWTFRVQRCSLSSVSSKSMSIEMDDIFFSCSTREIGSVAMCSGGGAMEYGTFLASELFAMSSAAVHTGRPISKRAASDVMCLL